MTLGLVQRLKNSDFVLKSKKVELTQNKKSNKPPDWPETVWELIAKFGANMKILKFGVKNTLFAYFWTGIWKY